jgi:adenosylmethionine---8-amino-7-oxononanoate aminotransferase
LRGLEPARALPHVRDVRVKGAIGVGDLGALRHRFIEAGVFVRPIRNIVYLTPAFTIGEDSEPAHRRGCLGS